MRIAPAFMLRHCFSDLRQCVSAGALLRQLLLQA